MACPAFVGPTVEGRGFAATEVLTLVNHLEHILTTPETMLRQHSLGASGLAATLGPHTRQLHARTGEACAEAGTALGSRCTGRAGAVPGAPPHH